MAKKQKTKKNSLGKKILNYIAWFLAFIALLLGSLIAGYYIGYEDAQDDILVEKKLLEKERMALEKSLEKAQERRVNVNKKLQEVLKNRQKEYISASHEFDDTSMNKPPENIKREIKRSPHKPKLAIIIDDVSTAAHIKAIKDLSLPITMSFLPPSKARPSSAKLASKEDVYMVHLPLEAQNYSAEEPNTLRIEDSQEIISQRIKEIKRLFPKVQYINNHTGSKFTSNENAMNKLIYAMNSEGISFIDSRTTAKTTAPKVLKNLGLNYVARDIFLDHENDKEYILAQIKKAVGYAKSHGTAIAIGHPHKNTFLALGESKEILEKVDLVYINRLH